MIESIRRWWAAKQKAADDGAAEREKLEQEFQEFIETTKPLVLRKSDNYGVGLYRHAWRRARMLKIGCEYSIEKSTGDDLPTLKRLLQRWERYERLAAERYYQHAPKTLYGQRQLEMEPGMFWRIYREEVKNGLLTHLQEPEVNQPEPRPYACIYIGTCEAGRVYIGQTVGLPEARWLQHRTERTGPFKNGERYVKWEVVEGGVEVAKLNEREAYYIGFFNSCDAGYNDTKGNNWQAYERGKAERDRQGKKTS